ncbi:uncharacterized protein LOC127812750 [Diospyros lotus]|uniref:uncharacterized protein LOC127812750 n=1 Tax=Diospyros lotus TaxID=55363 RepID=UPI0022528673|nr:uncharacterized protein LOC127812750 [Diospyros lotus]
MVKKANGKWLVCIDFKDLNKDCPKDSYSLPRIDCLVDETSGYAMLNFLDAFSGYHQISMCPPNAEKTACITENGMYCYKVITFGLKNAEATYQLMVNKVFKDLLGDMMEVYVDDMIMKTKLRERRAKKLAKVFEVFRENRMRLNPRNKGQPKEGARNGRYVVPNVRERSLEIDKSFANIGAISVQHHAVNAILVRQAKQFDRLVYYVSKVFQEAESQYPYVEKVALALVTTARKLRPYFQAHVMIVLIDQPLRQILQRPKCSGRLTKWAIELSEYDISFEQRKAIKVQELVDFIVECTHVAQEDTFTNEWLFVDGASNARGSGVGVVLISSEKEILEYSLHFTFSSSNNTAEYEALLIGMRLAKKLEVTRIIAHSDSQLVV